MRRRSKVEAQLSESRTPMKRYAFYGALVLLSLVLPAALTLRGDSSTTKSRGGVRRATGGSSGSAGGTSWPTLSRVDTSSVPWADGTLPETGPIDAAVWRGIGAGIPSMPTSEHDVHLVFSTDCSPYQNYQSIVLFNSAEVADQKGRVTRVASGCTQEEQQDLQRLMDNQPERFRVHFTPDYSLDPNTGERYMFYNKPNGMSHFLKNANPPVTEAVIALIDPDMVLVSALSPNVGNPDLMLWHERSFATGPKWVVEGYPVGQFYGLGGVWAGWKDIEDIIKDLGPDSPAGKVSKDEAAAVYPVGPPYMMHPHDWARVIDTWVDLSPKVYKGHPSILAEMYGFCIAAAHFRLRHRVAYGFMVSDSKMPEREGWPLVDPLGTRACDAHAVHSIRKSLPPLVHYCQLYRVGTYMFGKRHKSHHDFFRCSSDSLELPPDDYLTSPMGRLRVHPRPHISKKTTPMTEEHVPITTGVRQGYAMCSVLRAMNNALASFKNRYCRSEEVSGGVRRFTDLTTAQLATDAFS